MRDWNTINGRTVSITCPDGFCEVLMVNAESLSEKICAVIDDHRGLHWWTRLTLAEVMQHLGEIQ